MESVYTAAVIGGGVGGRLSLDALRASARFHLRAVADLRADVRQELTQRYPDIEVYASYEALLSACPVDVLCVSTYAPSHRPIALAALQTPLKGILVEKPLADTALAAHEIVAQARAQRVPMAVPHGLLVMRHSQAIRDLVRRGAIGTLRLVEIECDKWDIINAGIHWLNYFVALTDNEPFRFVMGTCDTSTRTFRDGMQVETLAITYAQTVSGLRVVMQTGDYVHIDPSDKGTMFRLVGTEGVIEFAGWESAYRLINTEHPAGRLIDVPPHSVSTHQLHLDALAAQIDAGEPEYSIAESSLTALELCEGAYLAHHLRCAVTLPLAQFVAPPTSDWTPGKPYAGDGGGRDGRNLPAEDTFNRSPASMTQSST